MADDYDWLFAAHGSDGDAEGLLRLGQQLESEGRLDLAATALDRAYGLSPTSDPIRSAREALLDKLAIVEHGIRFRYIPAGSFLMGSDSGDPDERPVHAVRLNRFWISDAPISWATCCDVLGWEPPPGGRPEGDGAHFQGKGLLTGNAGLSLREENKIRLQYCEDATTGATDWHAHAPAISSRELFGTPRRDDPRRPWRYDRKPMVSVSWMDLQELFEKLSNPGIDCRLPTEAEWEKAARGGLIGCRYPWGNDPPTEEHCDFNRFDQFSIQPMRRHARNGYGLYAMSGCVWEWTGDWYDAEYYSKSEQSNPSGPAQGQAKVLRGGSWADCAEAVTVSFRMSRTAGSWRRHDWGGHLTPNIGFRLCRVTRGEHVHD